jgi:hypothetical protein
MEIVQHPSNITSCLGDIVTIQADVSGYGHSYQWYKNDILITGANTLDLHFDNVDFSDAGRYKLQIFYKNCRDEDDSTFTESMQLFVYGKTEIVKEPDNIIAIPNSYVRLNIQTHTVGDNLGNAPVSYQWYRHKNNTIDTLKNGYKYGGVTSSTLIISSITDNDFTLNTDITNPSDYYYCVVKGLCDDIGSHTSPILIISSPIIKIEEQPISLEKCVGDVEALFTVIVSTTDPSEVIGYRWYKNGSVLTNGGSIIGANSSTLRIINPQISDAGTYRVEIYFVNLSSNTISSSTATLLVEDSPIITSITGDITSSSGLSLTLSVVVLEQHNSYACDYQWYKDGNPIPNANNSSYIIPSLSTNDEGKYYVVITSLRGCGETKSSDINVVIGVGINDIPTIDNFSILSVEPNPVTSDAIIRYEVPGTQLVKLSLLDLTGKEMELIYTGIAESGINTATIKRLNVSNGTYFIVLESNGYKTSFSFVVNK